MTEIEIIEPKIEDQVEINNLAKQVHKLHVNWNPDMFLDVEQVIPKQELNVIFGGTLNQMQLFKSFIERFINKDHTVLWLKER